MPYIKTEDRFDLDSGFRQPETAGELNYAISKLIDGYVEDQGLSYQTIAEILAACEGASSEFYRRFAAPFEDEKALDNGEVFEASVKALDELVPF